LKSRPMAGQRPMAGGRCKRGPTDELERWGRGRELAQGLEMGTAALYADRSLSPAVHSTGASVSDSKRRYRGSGGGSRGGRLRAVTLTDPLPLFYMGHARGPPWVTRRPRRVRALRPLFLGPEPVRGRPTGRKQPAGWIEVCFHPPIY
jgi:hypothetical protein